MTKMTEEEFAARIAQKQDSGDYSRDPYRVGSWQEKRITAMNRASFKKGWAFDEMNPWFDQWIAILKSKAKSLHEFKKEEWYVRSRKQS
jgi:hypothetical protein